MQTHKSRWAWAAALAVVLALPAVCIWAAKDQAQYLRILVSKDTTVYAEFAGTTMRLATSVEKLKGAQAIQKAEAAQLTFGPVDLPLSAQELPEGWQKVSATFMVAGSAAANTFVYGTLTPTLQGKDKAAWAYTLSFALKGSAVAEAAPVLNLGSVKEIAIELATKAGEKNQMGIGMKMTAGTFSVSQVSVGGKAAKVRVAVTDSKGTVIASKEGSPGDFGYT